MMPNMQLDWYRFQEIGQVVIRLRCRRNLPFHQPGQKKHLSQRDEDVPNFEASADLFRL